MKSTHRLFHVIVTTSAFALGCGGGSSAVQESTGPAPIAATNADGEAAKLENAHASTPSGDAPDTASVQPTGETDDKNAADSPKAKDGSGKNKGNAKDAKPPAKMGVAGW